MASPVYLCVFLAAGVFCVRALLPRFRAPARWVIGLCVGMFLLMWLPALFAFALRFSVAAHLCAAGAAAGLCCAAYALRDKRPARGFDARDRKDCLAFGALLVPLTALSAYLQYSHTLCAMPDGSLAVGQSTYGDLALHLSIITSLPNAAFPPEYSILPGTLLAYPFLGDAASASLYMMGCSLQAAVVIPGTLMMALVYASLALIARALTRSRAAAVLCVALALVGGGLGYLYTFDQAAAPEVLGERVGEVLYGFYLTPTNQPEPNNLRWSNIVCDMFLPQRTFLAGWTVLLPCLYLLIAPWARRLGMGERAEATEPLPDRVPPEESASRAEAPAHRAAALAPSAWAISPRELAVLSLLAGGLPLIHTHSFLALALFSLGFMLCLLARAPRGERLRTFLPFLCYGAVAFALSMPQLLTWTFTQTGGESFLAFQFNWVNNPSGTGLRDFYLWFYVKNIGVPFLLIVGGLFERNRAHRAVAAGAFLIFITAELVRFQPNEYDNNKLFYVWYVLCLPMAADFALKLWRRLRGVRARPLMLAGFFVACFASGTLTVARECVSGGEYTVFTRADVETAVFVRENTPEHAVFVSGTQHLNPVAALAGRNVVCGSDIYLFYHGLDTDERKADLRRFYADPANNADVPAKYGAEYVLVSSYERSEFTVNLAGLAAVAERVFVSEYEDVAVYRVLKAGGGG